MYFKNKKFYTMLNKLYLCKKSRNIMDKKHTKPIVGISCGDINGIGIEIILKTFSDQRMFEFCIPVVFAHINAVNYYNKQLTTPLNFIHTKDWDKLNHSQINVFNCWQESVIIQPGELNETGGKYAILSLQMALHALFNKQIDVLVTAPINKSNTFSDQFPFTGHTGFLKFESQAKESLMILFSDYFRVALATEHVPLKEVSEHININLLTNKLELFHQSLIQDFSIIKPKIAVLGLNPHNGDAGLVGKEEHDIIIPVIKKLQEKFIIRGPFSADAFFAKDNYKHFDGIFAMYHDQGLIPFKSLAPTAGVNFTAGLPFIRTSPDHGTALDIAGQNKAEADSMIQAIFEALNLYRNRENYYQMTANPIVRLSKKLASYSDE